LNFAELCKAKPDPKQTAKRTGTKAVAETTRTGEDSSKTQAKKPRAKGARGEKWRVAATPRPDAGWVHDGGLNFMHRTLSRNPKPHDRTGFGSITEE